MDVDQTFTFLIADSDYIQRKTNTRILKDIGYQKVLQADDGTEAWSVVKNFDVDFVISAWNMEEMNGIALLKVIRTDLEYNSLPVVLVVDNITRSQVIEAGEAGVSDLIVQPFTPDSFTKKIREVIDVDLDPKTLEAESNYEQGLKMMKDGRWEEALASFKKILSVYENAEIYYNMGYIQTVQGNYDEAILNFRKATLINNAYARAYKKMGEAMAKLGKTGEAEIAFQQAADIYMEKEMDENAEEVLMEVTKLNPKTINVYNSLGIVYRRQGKFDEAVKQYNKAVKVNPDDEHIYYNLSRVYLQKKDVQNAKKAIQKAVMINPDFVEAKDLLKSLGG